jgi:hypothetical protein
MTAEPTAVTMMVVDALEDLGVRYVITAEDIFLSKLVSDERLRLRATVARRARCAERSEGSPGP